MNKSELLNVFECQKEQENATNNLLIVKREQFKNYCENIIERYQNTFNEYFPNEITNISKLVGCIDIDIHKNVSGEILRFNVCQSCFIVSLISTVNHTINVFKPLYGDEKWSIYDVSRFRDIASNRTDSELAYDSGVVDLYKYLIDMVDLHISEFYQKLAEKNQARIDKMNKNLASVSGNEEPKKKSYTIQITIEEEN